MGGTFGARSKTTWSFGRTISIPRKEAVSRVLEGMCGHGRLSFSALPLPMLVPGVRLTAVGRHRPRSRGAPTGAGHPQGAPTAVVRRAARLASRARRPRGARRHHGPEPHDHPPGHRRTAQRCRTRRGPRSPPRGRTAAGGKQTPAARTRLTALVDGATAGDPVRDLRWTYKALRPLAAALRAQGIRISANTVGRLRKAQGYSRRTNRKRRARAHEPDRDRQFRFIARQRRRFHPQGDPAVSIDTKKKELVGLFTNPGRTWRRQPVDVWDQDCPTWAVGRAVPCGVYDAQRQTGFVVVGTSHETAAFAAEARSRWWEEHGRWCYPRSRHWFLEAARGGANSSRTWAWKWALQKVANRWGVAITVAPDPPGASKWHPIEPRLFSRISATWHGEPLQDFETVLGFSGDTTSSTGLRCRAVLDESHYPTRVQVTAEPKRSLRLRRSKVLPHWNSTLLPQGKRPSCF